ncbi:hypothetical protein HHI36_019030 [Cryptolaemus montrouzieri]|uniref:PDZ domain-containing protein n=1 Tax=Cryptolaemus montrouzieri TaxID=559131 RepID=A0ABD2P1Y5_9CUCU
MTMKFLRRSASSAVNGSPRRMTPQSPGATRPASLLDSHLHIVHLVVNRDEKGYGMKVSGDNPVYVQSVKEGGAAEKAGLHAGDKIIKVNGVNVMSSTHTDVVALIRCKYSYLNFIQAGFKTNRNHIL